jgi:hypothetical protein
MGCPPIGESPRLNANPQEYENAAIPSGDAHRRRMGVTVMLEWCVCVEGYMGELANGFSAERCPHVRVVPRLQKSKLLRAWTSLLQDQSLEIYLTERYGYPQLGVRTTRAIVGEISTLTFLNAALHPAIFADDLADIGLEGISIFDERRSINGKDARLLFLGAGPARLINVSLSIGGSLRIISMLVLRLTTLAGYQGRHGWGS